MSLHTHTTWRRRFLDRRAAAPARRHRGTFDCEALEGRRVPATLAPVTLAPADYNGDGQSEIAVFQPETSTFTIQNLEGTGGNRAIQFGQGTRWGGNPVPVVADYNGDGMAELSVYQPSTSTFSIRHLTEPSDAGNRAIQFGQGTLYGGRPVPVVADYNDDGKAEIAVYQTNSSTFTIMGLTEASAAGNRAIQFGRGTNAGGTPIPAISDTNGDGKVELIVYQTSTSTYQMADLVGDQVTAPTSVQFGQGTLWGGNPTPVCADFDGDGRCELTVYQPTNSTFYVRGLKVNGVPTNRAIQFGQGTLYGGRPVALPGLPIA